MSSIDFLDNGLSMLSRRSDATLTIAGAALGSYVVNLSSGKQQASANELCFQQELLAASLSFLVWDILITTDDEVRGYNLLAT